jgi:NADPH:quinone reductase-like Zn-dependent oxidoreductase
MKAVRITRIGGPEVVEVQDIAVPSPGPDEVLVRVYAAGVAPWDAIIREGRSEVSPQPPLTLGSDLAGVVERVGDGVTGFRAGDSVYGVTNSQFVGAQAEFAVCKSNMIALKPGVLDDLEAGSAPVIAVTAWQMMFEYKQSKRGDTVLVVGAAGNVGAYAVQMAVSSGITVVAVARQKDKDFLRKLGANVIVQSDGPDIVRELPQVDAILDLVGGETLQQAVTALKQRGKLISVVSQQSLPNRKDVDPVFFYADVTTARLKALNEMFERGRITPRVGSVLPLEEARRAYELLAGAPHDRGKIMLRVR